MLTLIHSRGLTFIKGRLYNIQVGPFRVIQTPQRPQVFKFLLGKLGFNV